MIGSGPFSGKRKIAAEKIYIWPGDVTIEEEKDEEKVYFIWSQRLWNMSSSREPNFLRKVQSKHFTKYPDGKNL